MFSLVYDFCLFSLLHGALREGDEDGGLDDLGRLVDDDVGEVEAPLFLLLYVCAFCMCLFLMYCVCCFVAFVFVLFVFVILLCFCMSAYLFVLFVLDVDAFVLDSALFVRFCLLVIYPSLFMFVFYCFCCMCFIFFARGSGGGPCRSR